MERMSWKNLLSELRPGVSKSSIDENSHRNQYVRDYDRIVFSHAFHRLARKTQVHPLAENDHIHNRLTHSIEVSSIGRSLAYSIGQRILKRDKTLKEDKEDNKNFLFDFVSVVQAACIAHDIGNPPFGHAGEHAIRDWFSRKFESEKNLPKSERILKIDTNNIRQINDFKFYEGNAQGFRICSHYDSSHKKNGIKISYATLGAMMKYPWLSDNPRAIKKEKFNIFSEEIDIFDDLANKLGLIYKCSHHGDRYCRHPLAFIVEAADDICYQIIDLMDAIELDLIDFEDVFNIIKGTKNENNSKFQKLENSIEKSSKRTKVSRLRSYVIDYFIRLSVPSFIRNYEDIMSGEFDKSLLDYQKDSEKGRAFKIMLEDMHSLTEKVLKSKRKVELEIGAYTTMKIILNALIPAMNDLIKYGYHNSPFKTKRILDLMNESSGDETIDDEIIKDYYIGYMKVMDFISGMTDNYATYIAKQISGDAN